MASRCGQGVDPQELPARPPPDQEQEYDFVEEPATEFFCAVSLQLLREPQQTDCCGHHFSVDVARRLQREGKPCPVCQRANFTTHLDILHRRKIRQLTVRCQHKANGCGWVGELANLGDHVSLCPKQPWKCAYCALTGLKECESDHMSVCGQYPVSCPNRCEEGEVPRSSLEQHLTLCPLQEVECEYAGMGCEVRLARREMRGHLEKEGQSHLLKMCTAILAVSRELSRSAGEREREREAMAIELKEEVGRVREEVGGVREDVGRVREEVGRVKEEVRRVWEEVGQVREEVGQVREEVGQVREKVVEMEQRVREEMRIMIEKNRESEGSVAEGVREMEGKIKKEMELVKRQVAEIHHEDVLIPPVEFTITNFPVLKAQSKEWRSPPFYTHRGGYKMCLGVHPNGLRMCRGSHVSVVFYKMRDANTNSLKWDVKLLITIQCLNQISEKWEREYTCGEGISHSKPARHVVNNDYCCLYLPHTELAEYVKNDSFCIRVTKFTVQ